MTDRREVKRVTANNWIGGVCGGIAYAFNLPAILVRMVTLFLFIFPGMFIAGVGGTIFGLYIIFWIFAPSWEEDPEDYPTRTK